MKQHKTSLVLFDCDGTLVDSERINAQGMADVLIKLGHKKFTTDFCLKNFIGCSAIEIIQTLQELKIEDPHKTLDVMHKHALSLAENNLNPISNALEMISKIKIPKCIVSNGDRRTVIEFLKNTNLLQNFEESTVFTREQVKLPKPSPDLYLLAAAKMKTAPKNCLVVEDSIIGITAAKRAGMKVLGFIEANSFHEHIAQQIRDAGADHIIHDLLDVLNHI